MDRQNNALGAGIQKVYISSSDFYRTCHILWWKVGIIIIIIIMTFVGTLPLFPDDYYLVLEISTLLVDG